MIVSERGQGGLRYLAGSIREWGRTPRLILRADTAPELVERLGEPFDGTRLIDDLDDPARLADAACDLAGGRPAALFSWDDGIIAATGAAAELLGLRGVPGTALHRCRNKYAARRALRAAGLSSPGFALLGDADDAAAVAAEVGMPAVIKPVNGTSSSLVRRVTDAADLAAAYRDLAGRAGSAVGGLYTRPLVDPDTGRTLRPDRTFLVEGLLTGREYSVEVVAHGDQVDQVLLLDKFLIDEDFFERGFCWPPLDLDAAGRGRIADAVDGAVRALGLTDTTAHVEILDDPVLGPTVVEVNAGRPGGQIIGLIASLGCGVDLRSQHLAMLLGEPRPERAAPSLPPPLATLTLYPEGAGVLDRLDGIDAVEKHPDVMTVVQTVFPGERVDRDHETYPLNVLVAGLETHDELMATYRELDDAVTFVLRS